MKTWIIEMLEENGKITFRRENKGFNPYELLGICEDVKSDVLIQLNNKNAVIEKELVYDSDGKRMIRQKKKDGASI